MTIHKKKKCRKAKWLSEEALKIAEKIREAKGKCRKEKIYPFECRFQRISYREKKPSSVNNAKRKRKTIEWERLDISSRKLEISRVHFMQRWAQ